MFNRFKKKKTSKAPSTSNSMVKALYVLTLTTEKMPGEMLKPVVHTAAAMLKGKDSTFAQLMGTQMLPETKIEIVNVKYAGSIMHTPQTMQSTLAGWIKK